ncbi:hypothetical protein [Haliscomenobacter sp.]|uniref:hypothetical protein n=1 Tax=Haliscomenobacter sp. TaxID=2717303 RepID=UPI003BACA719
MVLPFHSNEPIAVQKRPKIIDSQVVFGTPSRDCSGSGICKLYTIHAAKHLQIACEIVPTRLAVSDQDLYLSFSEADCTESLRQKQFKGLHFLVEEAFQLPSWLTQKLNIPAAVIPAGGYLIQRKNGFIWLKLPITFLHH